MNLLTVLHYETVGVFLGLDRLVKEGDFLIRFVVFWVLCSAFALEFYSVAEEIGLALCRNPILYLVLYSDFGFSHDDDRPWACHMDYLCPLAGVQDGPQA
jgi:hypothetical protein